MANNDTVFTPRSGNIKAAWLQPVNDAVHKGRNALYVTSSGALNAYVITLPATSLYSAYVEGDEFTFKAHAANTGPSTLAVVGTSSLDAKNILIRAGSALFGGEIQIGDLVRVVYDGTQFHMLHNGRFSPFGSGALAETIETALRRLVHTAQFSTQGNYTTARDALTGTIGVPSLDVAGVLSVTDAVSHFIGTTTTSPDLVCHLTVGKKDVTFSDPASGPCGGIIYQGRLAPGINEQGYGIVCAPYFVTAGTGTHGAIVGIEADAPIISVAGGASVTETSAIRVGAGLGEFIAGISSSVQFAIKIEWGVCKFKGVPAEVTLPAVLIPNATYISWKDSSDVFTNVGFIGLDGSNRLAFGAGNNTRMYVHSGGQISVGTTVTTSANAADVVLANNKFIRGVNAAGTGTVRALGVNSADRVELGINASDVQYGQALVALGGGAAPTLGTIGGSGPATAAQNSWMRWVDSNGNTFWVPVWK